MSLLLGTTCVARLTRRRALSTAAHGGGRLKRLMSWSRTYRQHLFNVGVTTMTVILSSQLVSMKWEKLAVEEELKATREELDLLRDQTSDHNRLKPLANELSVEVGDLQTALEKHLAKPPLKNAAAVPSVV